MFALPPDEDPADAWKKDADELQYFPITQGHTHNFNHAPGTPLPEWQASEPLSKEIADRWNQLGFKPEMVPPDDYALFCRLFSVDQNCLMIKRQPKPGGGFAVTGHWFLQEPKK